MEPKYRLIPEDIPPIAKATVYETIIREFLKSKSKSVRVEISGKKPATIHQGLLKVRRLNKDLMGAHVVRRLDNIYLKK